MPHRKKLKPFNEADIDDQPRPDANVNQTASVGPSRLTPDVFAQVRMFITHFEETW